MRIQAFSILIYLTFALNSCSVDSYDVNRYKSKFEIHKNDFEKLINLLKTEHVRVGYSINENNLSHNIQKILLDLEITNVRTTYTNCDGLIEYEFSSFWTRKASLYFSKNLCEKEQSRKGYHANPSEMIEVWGLGDGWIMWIDYDFI